MPGQIGNRGGQPYSKENREKAATLRGLVLNWALKVMQNENAKEEDRKLVLEKILGTCMPKIAEITGDDGVPLIIQVAKAIADKNNINATDESPRDTS